VAAWLAAQDDRDWAVSELRDFDAKRWLAESVYRAGIVRAVELLGAPPATIELVRSVAHGSTGEQASSREE